MKRLNIILTALLAAQVVVAGGIYFGSQSAATDRVKTALLDIDRDRISKITIVDEDGSRAVLDRIGGKWVLPEYHRLPANSSKVEQTLDALASSNPGWPVASSDSGRERFEVTQDRFSKKIVLADAENSLQTIYFGTSPGYRQVHVREEGEDEIYSIKLDTYEIAAKHEQWLDRTLIQPVGEIRSLQGPDFSLQKHNGSWKASTGTGEAVHEEVESLANRLAKIRVSAAAGKPPVKFDHELGVQDSFSEYTYRFFKIGDDHFVSRSDFTQTFEIAEADYEAIVGKNVTQLVRETGAGVQVPLAGSEERSPLTPEGGQADKVVNGT